MSDGLRSFSLLRCSRAETFIPELHLSPALTFDKYYLVPNLFIYFDKFLVPRNHVPNTLSCKQANLGQNVEITQNGVQAADNVLKYFKN